MIELLLEVTKKGVIAFGNDALSLLTIMIQPSQALGRGNTIPTSVGPALMVIDAPAW